MGFQTAITTCLQKYVSFEGRASRSEYWFFVLFQLIVLIVAVILDAVIGTKNILYIVVALALLLPTISVAVRRLHDTNRSGWWYWILLVPIVGAILLIVWFCQKGTDGGNDYGANPLAP